MAQQNNFSIFLGQMEIEVETNEEKDSPANKRNFTRPALKWKIIIPCYDMPSTIDAEERRRQFIKTFFDKNLVQTFESIVDNCVFQLILSQTLLFAQQKNNHTFTILFNFQAGITVWLERGYTGNLTKM